MYLNVICKSPLIVPFDIPDHVVFSKHWVYIISIIYDYLLIHNRRRVLKRRHNVENLEAKTPETTTTLLRRRTLRLSEIKRPGMPDSSVARQWHEISRYVNTYKRQVFWCSLYTLLTIGIFVERAYCKYWTAINHSLKLEVVVWPELKTWPLLGKNNFVNFYLCPVYLFAKRIRLLSPLVFL